MRKTFHHFLICFWPIFPYHKNIPWKYQKTKTARKKNIQVFWCFQGYEIGTLARNKFSFLKNKIYEGNVLMVNKKLEELNQKKWTKCCRLFCFIFPNSCLSSNTYKSKIKCEVRRYTSCETVFVFTNHFPATRFDEN